MTIPSNFEVEDSDTYVEITDDSIELLSLDDSYEDTIGMTDEEVLQIYNDYLALLPETANETNIHSAEHLNDFVEYAVEQGIIEDTAVQRAGITKTIVRAQFKVVATAGSTEEEKQVLINDYLESGLSRKAWCGMNNIPIPTLVGWEKQLNKINKDDIIFVSPKPSKIINKDVSASPIANNGK